MKSQKGVKRQAVATQRYGGRRVLLSSPAVARKTQQPGEGGKKGVRKLVATWECCAPAVMEADRGRQRSVALLNSFSFSTKTTITSSSTSSSSNSSSSSSSSSSSQNPSSSRVLPGRDSPSLLITLHCVVPVTMSTEAP
ncbi:hypothetical protein E2C01_097624 [Portunus trituberculatus]|uniref:Uncharacterized protein n=1 Tax=Portunus trituberculatus TaxID=210409 RepID=A0A5B7KAG9_PORTR|nr:hypothetical protein [Portunus trituberculatus]